MLQREGGERHAMAATPRLASRVIEGEERIESRLARFVAGKRGAALGALIGRHESVVLLTSRALKEEGRDSPQ
jgi:hypothetical protein